MCVCVCAPELTYMYDLLYVYTWKCEDEDEQKEATGESSLGIKTLRNAQCLSSVWGRTPRA